MALSFAADIRPLFRDGDVECMKSMGVELDDPAWMCVAGNAQEVYSTVADGSMPPDEPWPADRVALFKQWMDAGYPGLRRLAALPASQSDLAAGLRARYAHPSGAGFGGL